MWVDGVEQDLVLVLAVQVDQDAGQLPQGGAGRERAVDEGPAAALARRFRGGG